MNLPYKEDKNIRRGDLPFKLLFSTLLIIIIVLLLRKLPYIQNVQKDKDASSGDGQLQNVTRETIENLVTEAIANIYTAPSSFSESTNYYDSSKAEPDDDPYVKLKSSVEQSIKSVIKITADDTPLTVVSGNADILLKLRNSSKSSGTVFYVTDDGDIHIQDDADLYIGGTGLQEHDSSGSGASLIGLNDDNFYNIAGDTDVQGGFAALDTTIGSRTYTEQNYVVNYESLTSSIDSLDMAVHDLATSTSDSLWTDDGTFIYPNNYNQLSITDTGYLGIGTTSPTEKVTQIGGNFLHKAATDPEIISSLDLGTGVAWDVAVANNYAYVTAEDDGMYIIDITDPENPTIVSNIAVGSGDPELFAAASAVVVAGNYAYVATAGIDIVDISDPSNPYKVGHYDNGADYASGIYISGRYAYLASNYSGLEIVDISDPSHPTSVSSYTPAMYTQSVYVSGDYAYLADDSGVLQIVGIADPTNPVMVADYTTTSDAVLDVVVSGKYAYLAAGSSGLLILDVSNPAFPLLVASLDTPETAWFLDLSGNYIYLTDNNITSYTYVIDVTDPIAPVQVGAIAVNGMGIKVAGKYAYLGLEDGGFSVLDINGMETPALLAGNIQTGNLTVDTNVMIGNDLVVNNGLNVGPGGLYVDYGEVSLTSNSGAIALKLQQEGTGDFLRIFNDTSEVFSILNSGNVGIGTPVDPYYRLEVYDDASSSYAARFVNDGNNEDRYGILIQAGQYEPTAGSTNTLINFQDADGGVTRGSITFDNTQTYYNTTSDLRLKENIVDTSLTLDTLMNIKIHDFNFIADPSAEIVHGVIAQELLEVFPQAVSVPSNPDDYLMVDYSKLAPLLIKSVQDQQQTITELRSTTDVTQGDVDSLLTKVDTDTELETSLFTDITSRVTSLETELAVQNDSFISFKDDVIARVTNLENFLNETVESSESTEDADLAVSTPMEVYTEIVKIFEEFKAFANAFGLAFDSDKDALQVNSGLEVVGDTVLSDVTVAGDMGIGIVQIDGTNSTLNVLGASCYSSDTGVIDHELCSNQALYFQKELAGNIDMFNGQLVFEPDGSITTSGTIKADTMEIAQITIVDNKSAGRAMLKAGESTVEITTSYVTDDSIILLTPEIKTDSILSVTSRTSGEQFTVEVNSVVDYDVPFGWMVVDLGK